MPWKVTIARKAEKGIIKLPEFIKKILKLLIVDLSQNGPVRGNWANYGKLDGKRHHCHLKKGNPTYVAVWEEHKEQPTVQGQPGEQKNIEVTYAGTHENAPY